MNLIVDKEHGCIKDVSEINAVGHQVVHGGESFLDSVLITDNVKTTLRSLTDLAPLHNPANIAGIIAAEKLMPNIPQIAVFDTAFHSTMPKHAYLYAIPHSLYLRHKVRRYGFHGTSHKYISGRVAALMQKDISELKIVSCHLGNGASITAIKGGQSIDTSMASPLRSYDGNAVAYRSRSNLYIMDKEKLPANINSMQINIGSLWHCWCERQARYRTWCRRRMQWLESYDIFEYRIRKYTVPMY